jgi:hypothetical protein
VLAGEEVPQEEDQFTHQDGRIDWVRWSMVPWRRANGNVGGTLLLAEFRTEQIEARRALTVSEAQFRATFENAAVGVTLVMRTDSAAWACRASMHTTGRSIRFSSCHSQLAMAPVSKPIRPAWGARLRITSASAPGSERALPCAVVLLQTILGVHSGGKRNGTGSQLLTTALLTQHQMQRYSQLRGYTASTQGHRLAHEN